MSDTDTEYETDESAPGLRTPIVAVLGHVDHGKTSLLDRIRGSAVIDGEAGSITQHIGATAVPLDTIAGMSGALVEVDDFDLPGLLFIDTPGHHSFSTLRARGGALADIAILVVDVNDGFQPQTLEAIDILRRTETPFILAANKTDTTAGWNPNSDTPIQESMDAQSDRAVARLNEALYEIIGELSDAGFSADMYWRVRDFQANVGIVPVSALTGEGVPDLLAVLMGLSQRYMKEAMAIDVDGPGAGTVLEVKEERGFGATVDVVLYDGTVSTADRIIVGGLSEPIETDVRALLQPQPLAEIRTESQFQKVDAVTAAAGVKIAAPELQAAVAGAPVRVLRDRPRQDVLDEVNAEIAEIEVETEEDGVVVKADTLGSLEALAAALEEAEIPIVHAEVGDVAPRDVAVASTAADPKHETILAFGVETLPNASQQATDQSVDIYDSDVIYQLVEEYEDHLAAIEEAQQEQVLDNIRRPARFRLLPDHVFRQSGPAVVGVEVLSGTLKRNSPIVIWESDGPARIGLLKSIQDEGADVDQLRAGERAAVSIDGPTVGRQIAEGDELWAQLPEKHAKILEQELRDELPSDEIEALTQYLERKRKTDPFWAK